MLINGKSEIFFRGAEIRRPLPFQSTLVDSFFSLLPVLAFVEMEEFLTLVRGGGERGGAKLSLTFSQKIRAKVVSAEF